MKSIHAFFTAIVLIMSTNNELLHAQSSDQDYIILKNGNKYFGRVNLFYIPGASSYITYNDSVKFQFSEIYRMKNSEGYYATTLEMRSVSQYSSMREILLKRVVEGKVDVYSEYSFLTLSNQKISYQYFSIHNGDAIEKINYKNLEPMLSDNLESMSVLKSYKTYRYMSAGMLVAGTLTTFYGLFKSFDSRPSQKPSEPQSRTFNAKPSLYIGFGIIISSAIPRLKSTTKLKQAIDIYNRN